MKKQWRHKHQVQPIRGISHLCTLPVALIAAFKNEVRRDMNKNHSGSFTLGEIAVIPSRNEIEACGKTLRLQPKAMEVLQYLACHHDRVIANEELTEHVWRGRIVTHGSVQKSINLLRKAFTQLVDDKEVITHYSKRGYQLRIQPIFSGPGAVATETSVTQEADFSKSRARIIASVWGLLLLFVIGAGYIYMNRHTLFVATSHRTQFTTVRGYTNEVGHERGAEPHPDNRHVAYIKESPNAKSIAATASHLIIRDDKGEDWRFASSSGTWFELAWSPSGRNIVAIEKIRDADESVWSDLRSNTAELYNVHVFSLDLENNSVLETHRLNQWQGHINSATWWSEGTIELVGKQGSVAGNGRYRYSLRSQRLDIVETGNIAINPVLSRVLGEITALASLHDSSTKITFLAHDQARFASQQLEYRVTDMSWLPDGSGVLIYSADNKTLAVVYRNGTVLNIPFPHTRDTIVSRLRYSRDGESIYFDERRPQKELWLKPAFGSDTRLTENSYLNYAAGFSPQGEKLIYISIRNNQSHIWVVENGQERQIPTSHTAANVANVIWTRDGESIIYRADNAIYLHHLLEGNTTVLLEQAGDISPIALTPDQGVLLALRRTGEADNIWRINYQNGDEKQLTFGSVASIVARNGDVYFQYTGQDRLWAVRDGSNRIELVTKEIEKSSKLLGVDDAGIYYVTGGTCHESDVLYLTFEDGQKHVYHSRDQKHVSTVSFHPEKGVAYTPCNLPESDIMVLE